MYCQDYLRSLVRQIIQHELLKHVLPWAGGEMQLSLRELEI